MNTTLSKHTTGRESPIKKKFFGKPGILLVIVLTSSIFLNFIYIFNLELPEFIEEKRIDGPTLKITTQGFYTGPSSMYSRFTRNTSSKETEYIKLSEIQENDNAVRFYLLGIKVIRYDENAVMLEFDNVDLNPDCYPAEGRNEPCRMILKKNGTVEIQTRTQDAYTTANLKFL